MILAHHSIFSMYGFWLPNDPRGSGSDYIAAWNLFRYGHATKVQTTHSVALAAHNHTLRLAAKQALKYPPVEIVGQQAVAVAAGFAMACTEAGYRIHACAILPEHIHLVIGYHPRNIRTVVGHLKSKATREVKDRGLWFDDERPLWGAHGWNVKLADLAAVERAIRYVEENPLKEGKRRQKWSFVTPFYLQFAEEVWLSASHTGATKRRIGGAAKRSQEEQRRRNM